MRLGTPRTAIGALVRLLSAAALVAVIAVGAPLHSHDVAAFGGDAASSQQTPCAACVAGASPGLLLELSDFTPHLEAVDVVSDRESAAITLPVAVRPGRAPPAA